MRDFLAASNTDEEIISQFNMPLINRELDLPLVDYIVDVCKSLEVLSNIKFVGYSYIDDETRIDPNEFITTRSRKAKDQKKKYIIIHDSRMGELTVSFDLTCFDKKEKKVVTKRINKKILLPIQDDNNYFTMKGKKYFLLYQMVDSSTYNCKDSIVLKSLLGIGIKRNFIDVADVTTGEVTSCPFYTISMFNKDRDIFHFYFATIGARRTLTYYLCDSIIEIEKRPVSDKNNNFEEGFVYFDCGKDIRLKVVEKMFEEHKYVRSVVGLLCQAIDNKVHYEDLENTEYWIEKIGAFGYTGNTKNYIEKGRSTLTFLSRMLDVTTKRVLRISDVNKKNIYAIIRWLIQNYDSLRKKDNLDLTTKRLRWNEFASALFTTVVSKGINKLITKGKGINMKSLEDIFKFNPNIIMTMLYKSGLEPMC